MCSNLTPKWDGYVYRRRKLQVNTVALITKENVMAPREGITDYLSGTEEDLLLVHKDDRPGTPATSSSAGDSSKYPSGGGNLPLSEKCHLQMLPIENCSLANDAISVSIPVDAFSSGEDKVARHYRSSSDRHYSRRGRFSSSKHEMQKSVSKQAMADGTEDCSSTENIVAEPLLEVTSAKELCISVLQNNGLLSGAWTESTSSSMEVPGDDNGKPLQPCKVCGGLENPIKMLICDLCEEAFHLSCCSTKVKQIPVDEWYCQRCFRKRPKTLLRCSSGKPSKRSCDPILSMLKDTRSYTTGVRIGREFQVEVPEWREVSLENEYFGQPSELDLTECASLNGWASNRPSQSCSIGNWIQCREMIYNDADENDEGTVCGKWRRAPLFVVQTDNWDCSCCLLWDPIHADCSVPQEVDTDTVLKHLKYVEMLRPRLAGNRKPEIRSNQGARLASPPSPRR